MKLLQMLVMYSVMLVLLSVFTLATQTERVELDRKIVDNGGVEISAKKVEHCKWKPDGINDGYKECGAIIEGHNPNEYSLTVDAMSFIIDKLNKVKGSKFEYYFSNQYTYETKTVVDDTCIMTDENDCLISVQRKKFYNWVYLGDKYKTTYSDIEFAYRVDFEFPQYEPATYNFSIHYKKQGSIPVPILLDPDVTACGELSTAGGTYTLTQDVDAISESKCIEITAANIKLDLAGYDIEDTSSAYYGIWIEDNFTSIYGEGRVRYFTVGIHLVGATGGGTNITNTIVHGSTYDGFEIHSDDNILNNISAYSNDDAIEFKGARNQVWDSTIYSQSDNGLKFDDDAKDNQIINCSFYSNTGAEIYSYKSTATNNSIINTTFSTTSITLGDILVKWYYLAYTNFTDGTVASGVNISIYNVSDILTMNTTTGTDGYTPVQHLIEYTDNAGTKSYFSNYTIKATYATQTSSEIYNATSGNLAEFHTFTFTEEVPPYYTYFENNASTVTKLNGVVNWSIILNDTVGLSHYFFAHNQSGGALVNVSNISISGTNVALDYELPITLPHNSYICGQYWFNDTYNNVNMTNQSSCFIVADTAPTITGTELNKTSGVVTGDDLNCTAQGISDVDTTDTPFYHYEWYKDSVAQGIDNVFLFNGNTSNDETWYCEAWAGDGELNSSKHTSSSVIIASASVAPVIVRINATTANTGINSTYYNPTNNNSWVNITVEFTDANMYMNNYTVYISNSSNWADTITNVSGEILCMSERNQTIWNNTGCKYNVTGYSGTNPLTIYAFVLDNTSLQSTSESTSFEVNHPPETPDLNVPSKGSFTNFNYTLLNVTGFDPNGDTLNYSFFGGTSIGSLSFLYNGTSSTFNWTELAEGMHYWKVQVADNHSYINIQNTTIFNFTIDNVDPYVIINTPADPYSTTTTSVINISSSDGNLDACYYDVQYRDTYSTHTSNTTYTCNSTFTLSLGAYAGGYILRGFTIDLATNVGMDTLNITVSSPAPATGGGGGAVAVEPEPVTVEEIADLCGNKVCEEDIGETPWTCPIDCFKKIWELDQIFCSPFPNCGNWEESWFINMMMFTVVGGIIYFQTKAKKAKRKI